MCKVWTLSFLWSKKKFRGLIRSIYTLDCIETSLSTTLVDEVPLMCNKLHLWIHYSKVGTLCFDSSEVKNQKMKHLQVLYKDFKDRSFVSQRHNVDFCKPGRFTRNGGLLFRLARLDLYLSLRCTSLCTKITIILEVDPPPPPKMWFYEREWSVRWLRYSTKLTYNKFDVSDFLNFPKIFNIRSVRRPKCVIFGTIIFPSLKHLLRTQFVVYFESKPIS